MRISRLKLVNFIGIKHGLGLSEFELNIPKSENKITLLLGENGSGKSTILSALHPFKESLFDDRKDIILEGEEGRKEIDIESDGHLYEIVHTYGKGAQSFFKKDGEELNDNGGVKTCEALIQKELGIKKDFFRISKIGSNTEGFIDLAPTDRKNFVGTFLNIDDIIEKYKLVNEKMKTIKKDIAGLSTELGKYQDPAIITESMKLSQKNKETTEESIKNLYTMKGSLDTEIQNIKKEIGDVSLTDLQNKANNTSVTLASNQMVVNTLKAKLTKIDEAEEYKNKLAEEINKLQTKVQVNASEKKKELLDATEARSKADSTKLELKGLGNPEDLENINKSIKEREVKINTLIDSIKKNPYGELMKNFMLQKKEVGKYLSKFQDFTDFIEKYFTDLSKNDISLSRINLEYFFDENFSEVLSRLSKEIRNQIQTKQNLKEQLLKEKNIAETYLGQLENLAKRPTECQIDTCPFIKEALKHKNVESEIEEKEQQIKQADKDLNELEIKGSNIQELTSLHSYFIQNYTNLMPRDNMIYAEFTKDKSLVDWLKGSLSDFQRIRQEIISNMTQADSDVQEFKELSAQNKRDNDLKKTMEDSDSSVRDKYEKIIQDWEAKYEKHNKKFKELEAEGKNLTDKLNTKRTAKEEYENYLISEANVKKYSKELEDLNNEIKRISELLGKEHDNQVSLHTANTTLVNLEAEKKEIEKAILNDQTALAQIKALHERLDTLNSTYSPIISVSNALNPAKGIPLIFMQNYLEETEEITNELLSLAYGDDFKIKFVTTEKEFSIQVQVRDEIKPDIKVASQGEISLTTISISLALIEQAIGDYNILCLDEIDGPLSKKNREIFIDILNKQISKLDIEQMFIISHNDAFDVAPVDLILLRENDVDKDNEIFMQNKNIIYDIERIDNE